MEIFLFSIVLKELTKTTPPVQLVNTSKLIPSIDENLFYASRTLVYEMRSSTLQSTQTVPNIYTDELIMTRKEDNADEAYDEDEISENKYIDKKHVEEAGSLAISTNDKTLNSSKVPSSFLDSLFGSSKSASSLSSSSSSLSSLFYSYPLLKILFFNLFLLNIFETFSNTN